MPWDPEKYNQFKNIRYQPFFDLAEMISGNMIHAAVDLGCGTGEQTYLLAEKFEKAQFLGVDPSPEMLAKSQQWESNRLRFEQNTVEDFIAGNGNKRWDLVFSNAALQWSDHHKKLFPKLIRLLNVNGQLAIQMPVQKENLLNQLLLMLVREQPFSDYLKHYSRKSPLLSIDDYAKIMFENGLEDIRIMQKVYPIYAESADKLIDFIAGSSLVPYLERMSVTEQMLFINEYKKRIEKKFKRFPAIYAFKRLLLYGKRPSK